MNVLRKIFGSKNDREIKRMRKIVTVVNQLEAVIERYSDEQIKAQKIVFETRLDQGETLEQILPEAFALVREAGKRALGMRIFDVQLIGGITLHEGRIAEMRTGEGKTLVATLPLYLNALQGNVHLVTVNDYLAKWGAEWMRPLYEALGMRVGVVYAGQDQTEKKTAYEADITYGTNNEFGFDYLRDNMAFSLEEKAQGELNYAIVDEVDSILIDEARTPLIITGGVENSSEVYRSINLIVPKLDRQEKTPEHILNDIEPPGDFFVDEKQRDVELTDSGHIKVEGLLVKNGLLESRDGLYGTSNLMLLHHMQAALKAHTLFHKDVHYIIQNREVVIVDEHTGRSMPGRRWSGGIHQAIEAKEGLPISNESQTLASTTFQNYFRIYSKLSGMTGTADTEAFEFKQIYGLDVVVIPTNLPMIRDDRNDLIYLTEEDKYSAIVDDIAVLLEKGAPVLVGTASIESSERLSSLLTNKKIKHSVLNAKFHEKEAEIIAQAGKPGTLTIATNMAGRGTDIILGGNWEAEVAERNYSELELKSLESNWEKDQNRVIEAGGLHVIGTERHESRRIDNQLRGRSGRQGDPGFSRFYLSLEDDLMRIFASDKMRSLMQSAGMKKGEAIEARMVTNAIEKAQRKVEGRNFDIRKQLLEYDDVANDQRQMIYDQRNGLMASDDISGTIDIIWGDVVNQTIDNFLPRQSLEEQWDIAGLEQACISEFNTRIPIQQWLDNDHTIHEESLREKIIATTRQGYKEKELVVGPDIRIIEKRIMLDIVDAMWKEHLASMDHLRQGIHLRAYAQKQPKQEYKREAFQLFEDLLNNIQVEVIKILCRVEFRGKEDLDEIEKRRREQEQKSQLKYKKETSNQLGTRIDQVQAARLDSSQALGQAPFVRSNKKIGRNELCPCGSGKKFKVCCGRLE
ncbi:MAG: preprotein translocase subunit SecA [Gammaproteobacteria bacterium TMED1]|nr:MAG: preprotein translocase subunit SecA [Gammaproteobacteria bacterium TMED1]|tara:strand:- start:87 stop:2828 length:2742 start_codon:yes stop_codon:yes gene_type:complete